MTKARDAVIDFYCLPPNSVLVSEIINGETINHEPVQRDPDVVTEVEKKYMFFAEQADLARRKIMRGESCFFNVYFREL
jgi:hypothetical protein